MKFVSLPVLQRKNKEGDDVEDKFEEYEVNVPNINYFRKWVGHKGELQTVIYFNGDAKYLIVDLPMGAVRSRIAHVLKG